MYSLALLSVQITCLGVWAMVARLVLTRSKVRVSSSIRCSSLWSAAEVMGKDEDIISGPPLLLLLCLPHGLMQRGSRRRVGCHRTWYPGRPDASQCWSGAPPDLSHQCVLACSALTTPASWSFRSRAGMVVTASNSYPTTGWLPGCRPPN